MPCLTLGPDDGLTDRQRFRAEFRHNSDVAEMLCDLCRQMEAGEIKAISPALQQWWAEHKVRDAKGG